MIKNALLSVLLITLGGEWIDYQDLKSGYSLLFPSEYKTKEDSLDAGIGMCYTKTISASLGEGSSERIFLANHTSYPENMNLEDKDSTGYYLCQTIVEQVKDQLDGGKILYNTSTKINGMSAQLASIQYGDDASMVRMALVMYKNTLMSLQYYGPFESGISSDAEKFFYSYKRIK